LQIVTAALQLEMGAEATTTVLLNTILYGVHVFLIRQWLTILDHPVHPVHPVIPTTSIVNSTHSCCA